MRKSLWLAAFLISNFCLAGVGSSLMQTANVQPVGSLEAKIQSDIIMNFGGGFNLTAHGVTGVIDHIMDLDVFFGTGATDFQLGGLLKYNILPDMDGQVGLSFLTGYRFLRDNAGKDSEELVSHNLFTFGVLGSKTFALETMTVIPYASFQIEALMKEGASRTPLSLLIGNKWLPQRTAPWNFYSELGLSLRDSHFSLNFGASYLF